MHFVSVGIYRTILDRLDIHLIRVADPDPNLSGRIRIRKIFTGSGSYQYFGNVKLYKQGKFFKNKGFTHFQVNFSIFSDNNPHSNIRRNMFDVKKFFMFELNLQGPVGSGIRF